MDAQKLIEAADTLRAVIGTKSNENAARNINLIGQTVIVRTYSAGVWCGTLAQKDGEEIILTNARRMWKWWAAKSISLSAVVAHGIKREGSKIAPLVPLVALVYIEIMPITGAAAESIMGAQDADQE